MLKRRALDVWRALAIAAAVLAAGPVRGEAPVVAVVALNEGTETTDFLVPFGVLHRAGVRVEAVATARRSVLLHPGDVELELDSSLADFDARHPGGADAVIVPAVMNPEDPVLLAWVRRQAGLGALVMAVCDGAFVLAHAGLLDGLQATGHWYSRDDREQTFPAVVWVRDRRYVAADAVVTTTGVSASVPATLALVERLAGAERARAVAASLGVDDFGSAHDSDAFALDTGSIGTAAWNLVRFWRHEVVGIEVSDGVDEVSLALTADALARTWMSEPRVLSDAAGVTTAGGLRVLTPPAEVDRVQPLPAPGPPPLVEVLRAIEDHYGRATSDWVALQVESPPAGERPRASR